MNQDAKTVLLAQEVATLKSQIKKLYMKQGLFKALTIAMEEWVTPMKALPRVITRTDDTKIMEHAVLHLSDEHADQVVESHRVGFMEEFNFNVALCRAEKLIDTVIDWTQNKLPMHTFPVLHIFLTGIIPVAKFMEQRSIHIIEICSEMHCQLHKCTPSCSETLHRISPRSRYIALAETTVAAVPRRTTTGRGTTGITLFMRLLSNSVRTSPT